MTYFYFLLITVITAQYASAGAAVKRSTPHTRTSGCPGHTFKIQSFSLTHFLPVITFIDYCMISFG